MNLSIAPLFSGSGGNATYIGTDSAGVLVDAGLSGSTVIAALKQIGKKPEELSGILVTHEHLDHIKGIGVLSRKYDLPIFANAETWESMEDKIGGISLKNMRTIDDGEFFIGDMMITPIPLSHDAANPTGYAISANGSWPNTRREKTSLYGSLMACRTRCMCMAASRSSSCCSSGWMIGLSRSESCPGCSRFCFLHRVSHRFLAMAHSQV